MYAIEDGHIYQKVWIEHEIYPYAPKTWHFLNTVELTHGDIIY